MGETQCSSESQLTECSLSTRRVSCGRNPVILRITADRIQLVYNKTCVMRAKLSVPQNQSQLTECSLSTTRRVSYGIRMFLRITADRMQSTTRRVSCGIRMFLRITADRMQSTRLVLPKVVGRIRLRSKHFDISDPNTLISTNVRSFKVMK